MPKKAAIKKRFAECHLCEKRIPEEKMLMLSHLIECHPLELLTSESFRGLFSALSESSFNFGNQLAKIFRGES
jgi:hypothetical protein